MSFKPLFPYKMLKVISGTLFHPLDVYKRQVEELLNKMKKGEQLSVSEMAYVKIFANLSDYERACLLYTSRIQ